MGSAAGGFRRSATDSIFMGTWSCPVTSTPLRGRYF
ncbi:MAG: hypothetical protein [Podoviridae sp. ctpVR23]|nr:MAG: hypothetical protein [Podoviridae sp. ctpVR23]